MVKKLNLVDVQKKINEKQLFIFSPKEFQILFKVSNFSASKFIYQYNKKNFFNKIRNGLYCLNSKIPSSFELANRIYEPSYISLETALAFYGIIPETTYSITSVSTKATRSFYSLNKEFSYQKIKKELFSGYYLIKNKDESFLIAEPEKALVDYFYFCLSNDIKINDRINVSKIKKFKINKWKKFFNNPKINNLLEKYVG